MTFFHNPRHGPKCRFRVKDQWLEDVESYKYLGYVLDSHLNYNLMMNQLVRKMNYKIYLLAKLRPMLTTSAALAIYKSSILSYLDYNILFLSSARKLFQNKFQILQNKAIRIICKLPGRTNVDKHHIRLNIWHVLNRHRYFLLKHMYILSQDADSSIRDIRNLPTRMHVGRPFVLPTRSSSQYMNSFLYLGRSLWNQLPPEMQLIPTVNQFCALLKQDIKRREMRYSRDEV